MNAWQTLLVSCAGNVVFFSFQVLYFRWKQRQIDSRNAKHSNAKDGEKAFKFELMWKDYRERKKINGGMAQ